MLLQQKFIQGPLMKFFSKDLMRISALTHDKKLVIFVYRLTE